MENLLSFGKFSEAVIAGEVISGIVAACPTELIENCRIEVVFSGEEYMKSRKAEEKTLQCREIVDNRVIVKSIISESIPSISPSGSHVNFSFKTLENFPNSFSLNYFNDISKIVYKLEANLYQNEILISTASVPILVQAIPPNIKILSSEIFIRKCCFRFGVISVSADFNQPHFQAHDLLSMTLSINNEKSKGKVVSLFFELWRKIKLRNSENHLEIISEMLFRQNEDANITTGESLLANGDIKFELDLIKLKDRMDLLFSTVGEHITCEYVLKSTLTVDTFCGKLQRALEFPVSIHQ